MAYFPSETWTNDDTYQSGTIKSPANTEKLSIGYKEDLHTLETRDQLYPNLLNHGLYNLLVVMKGLAGKLSVRRS